MAELNVYYNAGSDVNSSWTNEANAWDGATNDYASKQIPASTNDTTNYLLSQTVATSDPGATTISKVEIAINVTNEYGIFCDAKVCPVFGGTTDGNTHTTQCTDTPTTYYTDITSDTNAPATWSWSDISSLDIKTWGNNTIPLAQNFSVY